MIYSRYLKIIFLLFGCSFSLLSQQFTQTIKGTVIDKQTQQPLFGANVVVLSVNPVVGDATDDEGRFRLENIPVGRQTIQVLYMGYEPVTIPNIYLTSAKEIVLHIELEEMVFSGEDIVITTDEDKSNPNNELSVVSSRAFTIEETQRYAGSLGDPSRMATSFAGVATAGFSRNDIIIRGNSPMGLLWKLDDINIPSPNHFGTLGSTGGPVSILNTNVLDNSDFMTGAFAAEYGNALSGVFDLKMRTGNSEKREYIAQVGVNGFELGMEGPFSKNKHYSYIANYRYSTLAVMDALGIQFGIGAIPQYQDLSFKLDFPNTKIGRLSIFGIGGLSYIEIIESEQDTNDWTLPGSGYDLYFGSNMGALGISYLYFINASTHIKTSVAISGTQLTTRADTVNPITYNKELSYGLNSIEKKVSVVMQLNKKFNAKNNLRTGINFDENFVSYKDSIRFLGGKFYDLHNFHGTLGMFQAYSQWQHKFNGVFSVNTGLHYQLFTFNNSKAIEPRLGFKWNFVENHTLSFGSGIHNQTQPLVLYVYETIDSKADTSYLTNDKLDFTTSNHLVFGYDYLISTNFRLKAETYYQYLYGVPVEKVPSSFSVLNLGSDYVIPNVDSLVNEGKGENYGIELTLEKFFSNHYYFLITTSLFQSKYVGSDGVKRNTAFNGNYITNVLAGVEYPLRKDGKMVLAYDLKLTWSGGKRYTPIDLEASKYSIVAVYKENEAFSGQYDDYFRADMNLTFRLNGKKVSQEWVAMVQNVFNTKNVFQETYDYKTNRIKTEYQGGIFPVLQYRILF